MIEIRRFYEEKKNADLVIVKAWYGSDSNKINVKKQLSASLDNNKLNLLVSNKIAGDPHPGMKKKLRIDYKYKGKKNTLIYSEGETINLP